MEYAKMLAPELQEECKRRGLTFHVSRNGKSVRMRKFELVALLEKDDAARLADEKNDAPSEPLSPGGDACDQGDDQRGSGRVDGHITIFEPSPGDDDCAQEDSDDQRGNGRVDEDSEPIEPCRLNQLGELFLKDWQTWPLLNGCFSQSLTPEQGRKFATLAEAQLKKEGRISSGFRVTAIEGHCLISDLSDCLVVDGVCLAWKICFTRDFSGTLTVVPQQQESEGADGHITISEPSAFVPNWEAAALPTDLGRYKETKGVPEVGELVTPSWEASRGKVVGVLVAGSPVKVRWFLGVYKGPGGSDRLDALIKVAIVPETSALEEGDRGADQTPHLACEDAPLADSGTLDVGGEPVSEDEKIAPQISISDRDEATVDQEADALPTEIGEEGAAKSASGIREKLSAALLSRIDDLPYEIYSYNELEGEKILLGSLVRHDCSGEIGIAFQAVEQAFNVLWIRTLPDDGNTVWLDSVYGEDFYTSVELEVNLIKVETYFLSSLRQWLDGADQTPLDVACEDAPLADSGTLDVGGESDREEAAVDQVAIDNGNIANESAPVVQHGDGVSLNLLVPGLGQLYKHLPFRESAYRKLPGREVVPGDLVTTESTWPDVGLAFRWNLSEDFPSELLPYLEIRWLRGYKDELYDTLEFCTTVPKSSLIKVEVLPDSGEEERDRSSGRIADFDPAPPSVGDFVSNKEPGSIGVLKELYTSSGKQIAFVEWLFPFHQRLESELCYLVKVDFPRELSAYKEVDGVPCVGDFVTPFWSAGRMQRIGRVAQIVQDKALIYWIIAPKGASPSGKVALKQLVKVAIDNGNIQSDEKTTEADETSAFEEEEPNFHIHPNRKGEDKMSRTQIFDCYVRLEELNQTKLQKYLVASDKYHLELFLGCLAGYLNQLPECLDYCVGCCGKEIEQDLKADWPEVDWECSISRTFALGIIEYLVHRLQDIAAVDHVAIAEPSIADEKLETRSGEILTRLRAAAQNGLSLESEEKLVSAALKLPFAVKAYRELEDEELNVGSLVLDDFSSNVGVLYRFPEPDSFPFIVDPCAVFWLRTVKDDDSTTYEGEYGEDFYESVETRCKLIKVEVLDVDSAPCR